jgi:hypothetical protein
MSDETMPATRLQAFIDATEAVTGVPAESLTGDSRAPILVAARRVLNWAMREDGQSYPQIGRMFGRDHTTILHSVRTATFDEQELALQVLDIVNNPRVVLASSVPSAVFADEDLLEVGRVVEVSPLWGLPVDVGGIGGFGARLARQVFDHVNGGAS